MKKYFFLITIIFTVAISGCKQTNDNKELSDDENNPEASDVTDVSANELLYNEVMKIHDEVMPKMDDIYRKKKELQKKLDEPQLSAEQKAQVQSRIAKLDSASEGMMVWMRKFTPISDSEGEEKAREYLEGEMDKVKKVREDILNALREADQ
jgi:hypothetical protein